MTGRVRFDLKPLAPFVFEVGGEAFSYSTCYVFAEIADRSAGTDDTVFKARDGRFFHVVITADEGDNADGLGVHHGWYTANKIDAERAVKLRESWAVLRPQPAPPGGPFA